MISSELSMALNEVAKVINQHKSFLILSHFNPDADAIGSSCGLAFGLKSLEKKVQVLNADTISERSQFIPGSLDVKSEWPAETPEVIIVCDCGDIKRVGEIFESKVASSKIVINIDHHASNTEFGSLNLVRVEASSTSELIFELLSSLGVKASPDIANALLAGIYGDTGSFRYRSTSARTFEIASTLVGAGGDHVATSEALFASTSLAAMKLQALAISQMELLSDDRIAVVSITEDMFRNCGADLEDADPLVEIVRDIAGVQISAAIRYAGDILRISLRSRSSNLDVSKVAQSFGGGGHKCAAAFRSRKSIEELKILLYPALIALLPGAK